MKVEHTTDGRTVEHLASGNIRVNGLLIECSVKTWAMKDARGNLVVGTDAPDSTSMLLLRNPTRAEAGAELARVAQELKQAGDAPDYATAFRMARRLLPLHAKVYDATPANPAAVRR